MSSQLFFHCVGVSGSSSFCVWGGEPDHFLPVKPTEFIDWVLFVFTCRLHSPALLCLAILIERFMAHVREDPSRVNSEN